MRHDGSSNMSMIGYLLHQPLDGSHADVQAVMQTEMAFQEGLNPRGEWNHPAFRVLPVRSAFAVDHHSVVLPVEVISGEVRKFHLSCPRLLGHFLC
jgi:hypothetical protein